MRHSFGSYRFCSILLVPSLTLVACGGGGGPGGGTAAATIVFPPSGSLTTAGAIRVRGSTPGSGVTSVTVAGVPATSSDAFLTFEAEVPLTPGTNTLDVDVTTSSGTTNDAAVATIRRDGGLARSTAAIAWDTAAARLIQVDGSESTVLSGDMITSARLALASATMGTGAPLPTLSDGTTAADVHATTGDIFFVTEVSDRLWRLDRATLVRTNISDASTGTGPLFTRLQDVSIDEANGRAIAVDGSSGTRALYAISLATGVRTVLSSSTVGSGPALSAPVGVVVDAAGAQAYVLDTTAPQVMRINLATGVRTTISSPALGGGAVFSSPRSIELDESNGRCLVAKGGQLLAIDLVSGARTVVSSSTIGTGPSFFAGADLALDAANGRALVSDLGEAVYAVDLSTGNRTRLRVGGAGSGPLDLPSSIAVDPIEGHAYVCDAGIDAIVRIDRSTSVRSIVSDDSTGGGPEVDGPVASCFGAAPGVLYVATQFAEILTVNVHTGNRTTLADQVTGTGPTLSSIVAMTTSPDGSELLVADESLGIVGVAFAGGARVLRTPRAAFGASFRCAGLASDPGSGHAFVLAEDPIDDIFRLAAPSFAVSLFSDLDGTAPGTPELSSAILPVPLGAQLWVFMGSGQPGLYPIDATGVTGPPLLESNGRGPFPVRVTSMDAAPATTVILTLDANDRAIEAIDVQTGDRVIVAR